MTNDVICFELNSWAPRVNYPDAEPFLSWVRDGVDSVFTDEAFIKENSLCVVTSVIDQSVNFCITAAKDWVQENCPELLTKYTKFLRMPDENGVVYGKFGDRFLEYSEQNIGIQYD